MILSALAAWGAIAALVLAVATQLPEAAGRSLAPHFGGSLAGTLTFVLVVAILSGLLALAAGVVNAILFSLVLARLYLAVGEPKSPRAPGEAVTAPRGSLVRHPRLLASAATVSVLAVAALVFLAAVPARRSQEVAVIAHRGSSATAPENSLAAFRLAADQKTDYVELDVQESADGEVLVVHDSDLMKAAGDPMKIWQTDAARIRSVDIGSRVGPQFAAERVPTLAEALAVCKGRCKVVVELKQYGHDVRLEEKVVEIVEAAGMADDCVFMSLDHGMVQEDEGAAARVADGRPRREGARRPHPARRRLRRRREEDGDAPVRPARPPRRAGGLPLDRGRPGLDVHHHEPRRGRPHHEQARPRPARSSPDAPG